MLNCTMLMPHGAGNAFVIASDEYSLAEACSLWTSLGRSVSQTRILTVREPHPKWYIGKGQLEALKESLQPEEIVYCNLPINPVNRRELEESLQHTVWDRAEVVLRIFEQRAHTGEGKLQVQLASCMHQKRKLVGAWSHLDRQKGGGGSRAGPGEMQKELDKRLLEEKIEQLKKKIKTITAQRETKRRGPSVALVGYTNAGKTAALAHLTRDEVKPQNKLFATLDTKTRFWHLRGGKGIRVTDTVGFISDLPHILIDAFHATLEEAKYATLLLHLRDASDPMKEEKNKCVRDTLKELGVDLAKVVDVWTKIDLCAEAPEGLAVSNTTGAGWEQATSVIHEMLMAKHVALEFF